MAQRIEHHNDGQLVYVAIDPTGVVADADFVHPFIAVDYDADGNLVGFSASGPAIDAALNIYRDYRLNIAALPNALARAGDLISA